VFCFGSVIAKNRQIDRIFIYFYNPRSKNHRKKITENINVFGGSKTHITVFKIIFGAGSKMHNIYYIFLVKT